MTARTAIPDPAGQSDRRTRKDPDTAQPGDPTEAEVAERVYLRIRDRLIVASVRGGVTLRATGDVWGISGERVRQIVAEAGLTKAWR